MGKNVRRMIHRTPIAYGYMTLSKHSFHREVRYHVFGNNSAHDLTTSFHIWTGLVLNFLSNDFVFKSRDFSLLIDHRPANVQAARTKRSLRKVVFTRPNHFHWCSALFREIGRFFSKVGERSSSKPTTHKCVVDMYFVFGKLIRLCEQGSDAIGVLSRSPKCCLSVGHAYNRI